MQGLSVGTGYRHVPDWARHQPRGFRHPFRRQRVAGVPWCDQGGGAMWHEFPVEGDMLLWWGGYVRCSALCSFSDGRFERHPVCLDCFFQDTPTSMRPVEPVGLEPVFETMIAPTERSAVISCKTPQTGFMSRCGYNTGPV